MVGGLPVLVREWARAAPIIGFRFSMDRGVIGFFLRGPGGLAVFKSVGVNAQSVRVIVQY